MRELSRPVRVAAMLLLVGAAGLWSAIDAVGRWRPAPSSGDDAAPRLVQPARRSLDPPPAPIPDLPGNAELLAPLTIRVRIETRGTDGSRRNIDQTVSRALDRVHVGAIDGPEWYFERNPKDHRRASGFLIDHHSRTVVTHSESDLRSELGIPGWAQVLTLGVDPGFLAGRTPTREVRTVDGIAFARYAPAGSGPSTFEVWWNTEQVLPGRLVTRDDSGTTRLSVESITPGVNVDLLQPPVFRFPEYRVVDLADWQEAH